jgi:hypothetical protein
MKFISSLVFSTLCLAFVGHVTPSRALVILTNLPGTPSSSGTSLGLGLDDSTKAVGLTVGSTPLAFDSFDALISNDSGFSILSGGIYSDSSGSPGSLLSPFGNLPVSPSFPRQVVALTANPFVLQANTSYWFVLDGPPTFNELFWNRVTPNTQPTPSSLIVYNGYKASTNGGIVWSSSSTYNGLTINATPVPGPSTPVPGPLPIFGAAAAFRYGRKLRKRSWNPKA